MGIKDIIKPIGSQSFAVGIGVAALAYFFGPQLKQALRPVAVKGVQGVMALGTGTMKAFGDGKDKLSNMMKENTNQTVPPAKTTEDLLNFNNNLMMELKDDRETSNKILTELLSSISGLKDELSQLRTSGNFQQ